MCPASFIREKSGVLDAQELAILIVDVLVLEILYFP